MRKNILLVLVLACGILNTLAQTAPNKPKTISAGIINGKATSLPKPEYPAAAQAAKASGEVKVQVTIDEAGNVVSATAISGHPLLRQASEQAARQAKFTPTILSGQPVNVTGVINYNFVAPQVISDNEKKLLMMGLGAFLTVSDFIPAGDWEMFRKEDLQDAPQIADALMPLTSISKETGKGKRAEIIKQVVVALESKLIGEDAWQFEFGKNFGEIMLVLQKSAASSDGLMDEQAVKAKLIKIRDLINSAPADFPPDVLVNFKEIVKFADVQNLNSDENKNRFAKLIMETLNIISPDSLN